MQINGTEQDRDHPGFTLLTTFECALHLHLVTVVGGEEVGADEQENDGGLVQVGINGVCPIGTWYNLAIIPGADNALTLQEAEMFL